MKSLIKSRRLHNPVALGILLFSLGLVAPALALDPAKDVFQYNLRSWTRQNGLPANSVSAITQTKDGYLWLGTPVGLSRFDGVEFKPLNLDRFRSTIVTSLSRSRLGGLWFGLESGAFGFCDGSDASPRGRTEWGGSNLTVHAVLENREGDFWIAAQNLAGRLTTNLVYDAILNTPGGKDFYDATSVYQDAEGRTWIGTVSRGLFYWQNGVLTRFADSLLNTRTVYCLVEDKQGQFWVGTESGLLCFDANFRRKEIPLASFETRALLADRQGAVWAGTSGGGLVRYLNGTAVPLGKTNGLTDDFVTALAEDNEGSVWIGTRNGLNQLSDVKIPTFGKTEGLTAEINLAVCASQNGGIWVAGGEGLTYFDGHARRCAFNDGFGNNYVKRVLEAKNGDLYLINRMDVEVLSGGKLVARYPNQTWPTALTEDAQSVVVAVGGNLYRVGTNYFTPYKFTGKMPLKCWVFNLATGSDGSLWTASAEGICRVKDGATETVTGPDPLGGAKANYICEDSDGVIWAGLDSGIARIKNGSVRFITRNDGLFDNLIYAIVPDNCGALWVDSGRGFFRVSRRGMNDFADGKTDRVECAAYDGLDAVKTYERNQQEASGCKTSDGLVWFPTAQGIVRINPTNVPINLTPPAVDVDKVRFNGVLIDKPDRIVVGPGKGDLEFYYTALSYVAPHNINFRYKLDGYDRDWIDAGSRRLAFYTNLRPGHYHFQVVAANADGIWNSTGDSVEIELQPHYYQTVWFHLLCGLLAGAALTGVYSWRVRRLRQKQRALRRNRDLLETRVTERTAALGQANASLIQEVERRKLEVEQRMRAQTELECQKATLEKEIEERKRMEKEVERANRQLLDASRRVGQAEVASGVLHNVGNVLNSVNVSTTVISTRLRQMQVANLAKAAQLLQDHAGDLGQFLTSDQRGSKLPVYLGKLARHLGREQDELVAELKELADNVEHIKEIVSMQQAYASVSGVMEKVIVPELVEGALNMESGACSRLHISLVRDFEEVPSLIVDRHKVLQILINILQNATFACEAGGRPDKKIIVRIHRRVPDRVTIEIADNGIGIPPENLTRIFSHGFTTRENGHGFGLHSAALAAKQMGGTLAARSDGSGKGATFVLELPFKPAAAQPDIQREASPSQDNSSDAS